MAPGTPQRKKRNAHNNFMTNIGEQGRKTGLTLPEQPRDEYGMEPADSLFTSPMKSVRTTGRARRKSNTTDSSSETMEVASSSAPDVTEVLTARASQKRASIPPPTRSPLRKTNIGGTPRRHLSLGPQSSPQRNRTPEPVSSPQRSVPRLLNFSMNETLRSVERSNTKQQATPRANGMSNGSRRSIYSIEQSPLPTRNLLEQYEEDETELADDEPQTVGGDDIIDDVGLPGLDDDEGDNDDAINMDADEQIQIQEAEADTATSPQSARRKSGRRSDQSVIDPSLLTQEDLDDAAAAVAAAAASAAAVPTAEEEDEEADEVPEMVPIPAKKRGPGRPKKSQANGKKTALAKRDVNAPQRPSSKAKSESVPRSVRAGSVTSLQREREYTPNEDDGANFTRSGRLSYKPLAYWKGEEAKYESDGRHGMQTIHSVVRKEDVTPVKRVAPKPKNRKRKYNVYNDDDDDEETGEEPWEIEEGIVSGAVSMWDPESGLDAGQHEQEIAFAGRSIEARDVQGAQFRYAKTLTMGFFGSGIVEMPPNGFKRMKNSRKMAMVFFVHYGKVAVDVAGTRFTISKGGVWQAIFIALQTRRSMRRRSSSHKDVKKRASGHRSRNWMRTSFERCIGVRGSKRDEVLCRHDSSDSHQSLVTSPPSPHPGHPARQIHPPRCAPVAQRRRSCAHTQSTARPARCRHSSPSARRGPDQPTCRRPAASRRRQRSAPRRGGLRRPRRRSAEGAHRPPAPARAAGGSARRQRCGAPLARGRCAHAAARGCWAARGRSGRASGRASRRGRYREGPRRRTAASRTCPRGRCRCTRCAGGRGGCRGPGVGETGGGSCRRTHVDLGVLLQRPVGELSGILVGGLDWLDGLSITQLQRQTLGSGGDAGDRLQSGLQVGDGPGGIDAPLGGRALGAHVLAFRVRFSVCCRCGCRLQCGCDVKKGGSRRLWHAAQIVVGREIHPGCPTCIGEVDRHPRRHGSAGCSWPGVAACWMPGSSLDVPAKAHWCLAPPDPSHRYPCRPHRGCIHAPLLPGDGARHVPAHRARHATKTRGHRLADPRRLLTRSDARHTLASRQQFMHAPAADSSHETHVRADAGDMASLNTTAVPSFGLRRADRAIPRPPRACQITAGEGCLSRPSALTASHSPPPSASSPAGSRETNLCCPMLEQLPRCRGTSNRALSSAFIALPEAHAPWGKELPQTSVHTTRPRFATSLAALDGPLSLCQSHAYFLKPLPRLTNPTVRSSWHSARSFLASKLLRPLLLPAACVNTETFPSSSNLRPCSFATGS
ncbi:hypothetical protein FH972_021742 [Carpinus fangiana]|uniref:Mif2/CENP-C cupin domain-containing protein n=1 Tax=Carpinus fangiana TaxID=176857 RepID=A0A5N6KQK0_9ROSI|nr:hypothetical protein FH972_021742 [Carpinus fangiana]